MVGTLAIGIDPPSGDGLYPSYVPSFSAFMLTPLRGGNKVKMVQGVFCIPVISLLCFPNAVSFLLIGSSMLAVINLTLSRKKE